MSKWSASFDSVNAMQAQIYNYIDNHIQALDKDLAQLDAEIRADREKLGLNDDETAAKKLDALRKPKSGRSGRGGEGEGGDKKKSRKRALDTEEEDDGTTNVLAAPTANDPVYCYCQKPSHGEMVACDNEECQLEWFHLECVNLKAAPTGHWLCPTCAGQL